MCLGKIGERYSFKKKLDSQVEKKISRKSSVDEVMETILADENDPSTSDPLDKTSDKDGLMELFDQFPRLMSSMLD